MAISFDKAFGVHPHAMLIRSQRAELLATNIANADTPGYKAKDIDFATALKAAKSHQQGGNNMVTTNPNHIAGGSIRCASASHVDTFTASRINCN